MNESNAKKKAWLRRYLEAKKYEREIMLEMEELEGQYILPSKVIDGMPHGSGSDGDLSTFAAKYDELYEEVKAALEKRIEMRREVRNAIEEMENETEKILMLYRYIDGKTFEEIAVHMGYTWRWTMQIHGRALSHFEIPKVKEIPFTKEGSK